VAVVAEILRLALKVQRAVVKNGGALLMFSIRRTTKEAFSYVVMFCRVRAATLSVFSINTLFFKLASTDCASVFHIKLLKINRPIGWAPVMS